MNTSYRRLAIIKIWQNIRGRHCERSEAISLMAIAGA
jgi:hypothetical protein